MRKNKSRGIMILLLVLAAFIIIALAVPFNKNSIFWIALVFGIIAVAVGTVGFNMAFKEGTSVKSKFYGFPIARVALIYALIQILVSFLFMAVSQWVPHWVEMIVCFILLIVAVIGLVAADFTREVVEKQDVKQIKDTQTITTLRSKINALVGVCDDAEIKKTIQKLAEDFKYSDPVSSDAVKELEAELETILNDLQKALIEGNKESAGRLCRRCQLQLAERNRICKLNK